MANWSLLCYLLVPAQHLTTHYNPPTTLDGLRITGSSDGPDGGGLGSNGGEAERAVSGTIEPVEATGTSDGEGWGRFRV